MKYFLKTWDDDKCESNDVSLNCVTKDEAIYDAVTYKQAHENLEVTLYKRESEDSFLIERVLKVELSNEQKLAAYWNGSITAQLKNKQILSI